MNGGGGGGGKCSKNRMARIEGQLRCLPIIGGRAIRASIAPNIGYLVAAQPCRSWGRLMEDKWHVEEDKFILEC